MNSRIVLCFLLIVAVDTNTIYKIIDDVDGIKRLTSFTDLKITNGTKTFTINGSGKSFSKFLIAVLKTGFYYNVTTFIEPSINLLELGQLTMSFGDPPIDATLRTRTEVSEVAFILKVGNTFSSFGTVANDSSMFSYNSNGSCHIVNSDKHRFLSFPPLVDAPSFNDSYAVVFVTLAWTNLTKPMFITYSSEVLFLDIEHVTATPEELVTAEKPAATVNNANSNSNKIIGIVFGCIVGVILLSGTVIATVFLVRHLLNKKKKPPPAKKTSRLTGEVSSCGATDVFSSGIYDPSNGSANNANLPPTHESANVCSNHFNENGQTVIRHSSVPSRDTRKNDASAPAKGTNIKDNKGPRLTKPSVPGLVTEPIQTPAESNISLHENTGNYQVLKNVAAKRKKAVDEKKSPENDEVEDDAK